MLGAAAHLTDTTRTLNFTYAGSSCGSPTNAVSCRC
jgi:hypothetical protein